MACYDRPYFWRLFPACYSTVRSCNDISAMQCSVSGGMWLLISCGLISLCCSIVSPIFPQGANATPNPFGHLLGYVKIVEEFLA